MIIGIFGGTFDPPHLSHTLACLYMLETSRIERMFVIPCYKHPFGKEVTDFVHRYEMCRKAMERLVPDIDVLDIERQRVGVSYTIDTIEDLKARYPDDEFHLVIGSDVLEETHEWKEYDRIKELVTINILPRVLNNKPGDRSSDKKYFLPEISSTEVRERLRADKPVDQFISRNVLTYIREHELYT